MGESIQSTLTFHVADINRQETLDSCLMMYSQCSGSDWRYWRWRGVAAVMGRLYRGGEISFHFCESNGFSMTQVDLLCATGAAFSRRRLCCCCWQCVTRNLYT
ncbi:hypothetical protein Tsp_07838 [Trichinella spiralis]|uniref:hypothetical protein n=1 Tax=Trichinella spiralis TaxID=6334 RepID=UPI0001EFD007|nr:hypothetical protein Tsp_07838 [Trichinella spiralis]